MVGDLVNVERAQRIGDEVGGHHVSGHIDCTGTVSQLVVTPNNVQFFVSLPDSTWSRFLVPKGWIAIDGASLTVVQVEPTQFSVSLIPETLARTTLGKRKVGEKVNLEFDGTTKTVVLTMERLLPGMLAAQMAAKAPM